MTTHERDMKGNDSSGRYDLFTVWKEYEGIAVHFNELVLKLRFQALAGVAALSALIGVVLKAMLTADLVWPVLSVSFAVLCLFWVALGILDIFYYNRLLLGTVDAILRLEEASRSSAKCDRLELSTEIKRTVEGIDTKKWRPSLRGPLCFYGLVLASLLGLLALSCWQTLAVKAAASQGTKATTSVAPTQAHGG
jgi:hypothetical protein